MLSTKSWTLYGKIKGYFVWSRLEKGKSIFNITSNLNISGTGGYYKLESLLKLKGLY